MCLFKHSANSMLRGLAAAGEVCQCQLAESGNKMTKSRDLSKGGKVEITDQHVSAESLIALSQRLKCISFSRNHYIGNVQNATM